MVYAWFYSLEEKIKERHEKILIDMPDFTNKILILTGAGMTLRAALIKISDEMSNDTVLYQTLAKCVQMMRNGITDEKALDYMTIQCNTPQMRRFISVVLQNMKRGGTDVIAALQDIGREQWEERKAAAKRLCAEADSKLLFSYDADAVFCGPYDGYACFIADYKCDVKLMYSPACAVTINF